MTDSSHKSNIWLEIPSEPVALLGFIFRISEIISLSLIVKWSNLLFVRNLSKGNTLLLITGLHCCEKYSLKYCAFSLQFRINKTGLSASDILVLPMRSLSTKDKSAVLGSLVSGIAQILAQVLHILLG